MSNHEKEIEEALMNCIGNHDGVCSMTVAFKAGAKWQASLVTEEKILEIFARYEQECDNRGNVIIEPEYESVAKEIIALIKGEM